MRPTLACFLLVLSLFAVACGGSAPDGERTSPGDAPDGAAPVKTADVYIVRGEVVRLPDPAQPAVGFYVRHEAIDDFKDAEGAIVGMDAMTMQFPLSDPSLLEGVAVGDKIELTYAVDWQGDPMQDVTALSRLSADVELEFRDAGR